MFGFRKRRSHGGPFGFIFTIIRLILSLGIMAILLVGIYSAYKSFAGIDPLKMSPQAILANLLSSENFYKVVNDLLTADPKVSLSKISQTVKENNYTPNTPNSNNIPAPNVPLLYKFAIVSDSHSDNQNLEKALNLAKNAGAKFVIGLGDYTNVGTPDELRAAKSQFDTVAIPYYITAGDHDLWDARNRNLAAQTNFTEVFGTPYQSFGYDNTRFLIVFDADNYIGLDSAQVSWLEGELERLSQNRPKLLFVMMGIPLYHPSSDHVVGKVEPKLKSQVSHLKKLFNDAGVNEIFAGDVHFFSRYSDPEFSLKMTVVGAIAAERNTQAPRFVMVDVYTDGSYNVQDLEIK